ncbi:MAG: sugar ABC transporter permease [Clostridiales bacterium]|nr:sugar ABC transporter permease [Clostridiales bacterium]
MKMKKRLTLSQKRMINGYLFILPWLIGFIFFYIRSILLTTQFSFSRLSVETVGGYTLDHVGLQNYVYAFREHGTFKQILTSSIFNMVLDVPLIIFFSLFMAILLNREFKGRTLVRAIFFLPVIMNSSAIATALRLSEQFVAGGISAGSSQMSTETVSSTVNVSYYIDLFGQLALPNRVLDYIVAAVSRINSIITASGVQIVIFLAALQSIPSSMYEVAKIEGATAYETFWKVTFPMVMPHIITNVVYTVIDKFAESDVVTLAYNTAFTDFNYGLSSVFSLVSTAVTCLILILAVGFLQKRTFYYN